jgi:CTP synthase
MVKCVVVTGGVISGVGKGIVAASVGRILKEYGYRVALIKIDPYINFDAGTLRPTEHGEVWVTDDGGEIDQDLGTYERFMGESLSKLNHITTGQIYKAVIDRERQGGYLGKTVQFVPHILDEIRDRILAAAKGNDVIVVEIGGIVGDYENVPFLCAMKSLERTIGGGNVAHVLVTYLPIPSHINEMKTKPAQQSIKLLHESGIFPDFIICRASNEVDAIRREKIETYANIPSDCVISSPDADSIYQVPLDLERKGMGKKLLELLSLEARKTPDWTAWHQYVQRISKPKRTIKIAIVGKYVESGTFSLTDSYLSIDHALRHAGVHVDVGIEVRWINAHEFQTSPESIERLATCDGIIVPGGFGSAGVEGMIAAIRYAREHGIPYLGICYGMQLAVVEYARTVCGLSDAHTTEVNQETLHPVVTILPWQKKLLEDNAYGGTMRLGAYSASVIPHTKTHALYETANRITHDGTIFERHRHRYEINPDYVARLEQSGMLFSGRHERSDGTQLMEFLELPQHPFFIATQAHPEFTSCLGTPNPLFYGFVKASAGVDQDALAIVEVQHRMSETQTV